MALSEYTESAPRSNATLVLKYTGLDVASIVGQSSFVGFTATTSGDDILNTFVLQGVAAALVYIPTEWKKCILHRDIKPANVLLDCNMEARLGDFGLSRLVEESIMTTTPGLTLTALAGTMGYMAPELVLTGRATTKSDLFSFGVLSLEVACGIRPQIPNQEIQLLDWVWQMQEAGTLLDVADPAPDGKLHADQLACMLHVGLMCPHPDPSLRPSTRRVHQILNQDVELPSLPRSRPVAVYATAVI